MPIPNDAKLRELLKIKEAMLEQMRDLTVSEAMDVLANVTGVMLSAIEDGQDTEERRKAVVPHYRETLRTVMAIIRMTEAEFGNQMRSAAVPPKSNLN